MHLVFHMADGTANAVPVTAASTVNVKTWRPPVFSSEGATPPILVEDQTVSIEGIVAVSLEADVPVGAAVIGGQTAATLEPLTDAEAAALDAQFDTAPMPWEVDD